ncbi:probable G-protein coupled receptor 179 [Bufo bufo]|uniref:probable G-protein coupled receptor 179 n=1 Tax=Bufo bufo TaxID=8384 RepID=UPI001ABEDAA3|nr:probable G-protein coupled receptor 179 [Bufo bufo]
MAVLWWALLWCHHAQRFLHASEDFQSPSWNNAIDEWTPTPTPSPSPTSLSPLPTPSVPVSVLFFPDSSPTPVSYSLPFPPSSTLPTQTTPFEPSTPYPDQPDEEGKKAAVQFLHSGDLLSLSEANCSRRFEVTDLQGSPPESLLHHVRRPLDYLLHATNFLNMIFQASDMRESSIREDMEWYHALVRSLAGGDQHIHRAMLSFTAYPMSSKPQLLLQATKVGHEILLQDLSSSLHRVRHRMDIGNWSTFQANPFLTKVILLNDLQSLETPKWRRGDSFIMDPSHVQWSKPFLECEGGRFVQGWMVSLVTAFYGLKPDLSPEFKGTLHVDVRLLNLGIDQCSQGSTWFANTHSCDENSTQCVSDERDGSILGRYRCVCQPGYYRRQPEGPDNSYLGSTSCLPCTKGCATCVDSSPCMVKEDWALRVTVLSLQATGMLGVFLSMLVSYNFRESKRIRASGLILLETILFGSLLLYFPVFIVFFKPSVFRCMALRWFRLLGFCTVYGTIILKLYRVLKVFLSRTAQRVPYMTSMRLLRMLCIILAVCIWFLVAWTVGTLENLQRGVPVVIRTQTQDGLIFYTCDYDRWDYMMSLAELLFLCWGNYLCYGARTVPSAFHEPRYMGLAIHNEMLISTAFHILRFVMVPSLHPDWTLLLFFIHTHGTVTMTLTLMFVPKFLHAGGPPREEIAEVYEDELDLRRSRSNLNSSITSAWSEHSLDPDDIRDELKKLYAQLEVHKTKKMTLNNPHLQKKRSSRRGLGRSIIRRIAEIPDSVSKQSGREEREGSPGSSSGQRRRQQDSSSVKLREESLRQRVLSLRKSQSTYDHMQESKDAGATSPRMESSARDASLRDSLMRRNLARNVSLRSRGDSLRQAPLVCKSLSAHNLLADKKPLSVQPGTLQKSHSMMGSARGKGPLTDIPTERTLEGSRNPLLGGSFDKAEVCPWEVQELPSQSENRSQKHVTYAPGKCSSLDSSHSSGKPHVSRVKKGEVGGKHHSLESSEQPKSPEEGHRCGKQNENECSSPLTIRPGTVQHEETASKGMGLETTEAGVNKTETVEMKRPQYKNTLKSLVLAVRAFKGTPMLRENKERMTHAVEETVDTNKQLHEEVCPWDTESSYTVDQKQTPPEFHMVENKGLICSSSQPDKNIDAKIEQEEKYSSAKASKQSPSASRLERMSQLREAVCPWESMEDPRDAPQKSNSVESRRSEICPWESTDSEGAGGPLSQSGSNLSFHSLSVEGKKGRNENIWEGEEKNVKIDICPWEVKDIGKARKDICPWEANDEVLQMGGLSGSKLALKLEVLGKQRDAVCPWESEESGGSPGVLSQSQSKTFDGCPVQSKTSDSLDLEARRGEICPWESLDSEGTPATMSQSQSHSWEPPSKAMDEPSTWESSQSSRPSKSQLMKSQSQLSIEESRPLNKIMSKSESRIGDLYSSKTNAKHDRRYHYSLVEKSKRCSDGQETSEGNTGDTNRKIAEATGVEKSNKLAEICPWEIHEEPIEGNETEVPDNKADVCPWDFQ